jgi:predicted nucleic acid-binding protein
MIVVDTNVVAYALIEGTHTALARRVWSLDPAWRLPDLWAHEYLNILATYARVGGMSLRKATQLWNQATELLSGCLRPVDMLLALELAVENNISAYDAQFVALARSLGVACVTEDQRLLGAFPQETMSMRDFCEGGGAGP